VSILCHSFLVSQLPVHLLLYFVFRYPVVYLTSIGPYSIARWLFFSGIKVKYQITLVFSTFFSLSGLFNTVLFFLTRPNLVTGHEDTPPLAPSIDIETPPFRDKELINFGSQKFGSLPTRSPAVSNYASPEGAPRAAVYN